ncbi:PTS ascorbate transporter subunit IIB [Bacteroides thetaiotaomicron]|nr:PTS ascorbate transporter subunit IIB [Bacteroides thetaiotaomicron]
MGSSVMLRVFVDKVLKDLKVVDDWSIEISDVTTAGGLAASSDVIIANFEVAAVVEKYGKPVIALNNMTSKKEIAEKLGDFLKSW